LRRLFEPLGYEVTAVRHPLDEKFPEWGESPYFSVALEATIRSSDLLTHLYVLIPWTTTSTTGLVTRMNHCGTTTNNQVPVLTELGMPTMHRAKIAQPRVRMEGWRRRRPGSNARNLQEGKRKTLLTHAGLLMEGVGAPGDNELVSTGLRQLWNSARHGRKVLVVKSCCAFGVIPLLASAAVEWLVASALERP
jgi:hypothetical protein